MRLKSYMLNENNNILMKYFRRLFKLPPSKAKKELENNWKKLSTTIKRNNLEDDALEIINRNFGTNYTSLDEIDRIKITKLPTMKTYESIINEDFKHFWETVRTEGFPTLSFWPALQCWLEIDKLIKGMDVDATAISIYGTLWLGLITGRFVMGWKRWKKQKPEEWEAEGSKKNPFSL